jgi:hypothetical protein
MASVVGTTPTTQVTTAVTTTGTALTLAKPTALADGHYMVAVVNNSNSAQTFTAPFGWTELAHLDLGRNFRIFGRYVLTAADEVATSYTFTASVGGRNAGVLFLVSGVSSANPLDVASYSTTTTAATGLQVPSQTPTAGNDVLVYAAVAFHNAGAVTFTAPAGMTLAAQVATATTGSTSSIAVATQGLNTPPAATGVKESTATPAASGGQTAFMITLRDGSYTPPPPEVHALILGAPAPNTFRGSAHITNATSAAIVVSTSADLSSPTTGPTATVDSRGYAQMTAPTSLLPNTSYYWGVKLDTTVMTSLIGTVRTLPAEGAASSFSFLAASCARTNSNQPVFDSMRQRTGVTGSRAAFYAMLGDMHYGDLADNGNATLDANYSLYQTSVFGQPRQAQLYREIPLVYMPSDHDFGGSNADKNNPNGPFFQQAYRGIFPHYDLVPDTNGDGAGVYHSFGVGRVLFIVTDGRSYMSSPLDTDGPAKTKLGATQKQWLKDQLVRTDYPVKIWFHEDGWNNASTWEPATPTNSAADDTWSGYNTERFEIGNFIQENGVNMWYVHGDFHALAADTGVNNIWGGFPLVCCSPIDQTTYAGNGVWSEGYYPNPSSSTTFTQQYGWFDVIDNGSSLTVSFTGYDQAGESHLAMAKTYNLGTGAVQTGWGIPIGGDDPAPDPSDGALLASDSTLPSETLTPGA